MDHKPTKRTAIVTGGGSGIGLAIAARFVKAGILTIIIGRDPQKLTAAGEQLGEKCHAVTHDLSDLPSIPALVERITGRYGQIDILVNNAGTHLKKEFQDVTDQEFDDVLVINLRSVFALSREVVKGMLPRRSGNIINISSMAARYGLPEVIAYTASKAGIEGMTR